MSDEEEKIEADLLAEEVAGGPVDYGSPEQEGKALLARQAYQLRELGKLEAIPGSDPGLVRAKAKARAELETTNARLFALAQRN